MQIIEKLVLVDVLYSLLEGKYRGEKDLTDKHLRWQKAWRKDQLKSPCGTKVQDEKNKCGTYLEGNVLEGKNWGGKACSIKA